VFGQVTQKRESFGVEVEKRGPDAGLVGCGMGYLILEIQFRYKRINVGTPTSMFIRPKKPISLGENFELKKMIRIIAGIQRIAATAIIHTVCFGVNG
jgi:hypothetical protein